MSAREDILTMRESLAKATQQLLNNEKANTQTTLTAVQALLTSVTNAVNAATNVNTL